MCSAMDTVPGSGPEFCTKSGYSNREQQQQQHQRWSIDITTTMMMMPLVVAGERRIAVV